MKAYPADIKARAVELREQGLGYRRISAALGVPRTTVIRWLNPDYAARSREQARAYKKRNRGTCRNCGARTSAANGPHSASDLCSHCWSGEHMRIWTPEAIIAAFRRFADEHGRPPVASEWTPALATKYRREADRASRASGHWPAVASVQKTFGSWSAGMVAAGFEGRRVGSKPRGFITSPGCRRVLTEVHRGRLAFYEASGLPLAEAAKHLGIDRSNLSRSIRIARQGAAS